MDITGTFIDISGTFVENLILLLVAITFTGFVIPLILRRIDDQKRASQERLRATLARIESAAAGMDQSFNELPKTLAALHSVLTPQNVARLSATLKNLEGSSAQATPAMLELRALVSRVDMLAVRFDQAASAASAGLVDGSLPQLNTLLRELTSNSRRLGRLIDEVESTPQMLLLGRSEGEPGPGERGFDGATRINPAPSPIAE